MGFVVLVFWLIGEDLVVGMRGFCDGGERMGEDQGDETQLGEGREANCVSFESAVFCQAALELV